MEQNETWISPFMKQCFVVLGVSLFVSQYGMVLGFTAYLLPELKRPDSAIPIDDTVGSWIVSIPSLSTIAINLFLPWLLHRCGRRALVAGGVLTALAIWMVMAAASNVATIVVARCVQGFIVCLSNVLCPMLVGEYTSPHNRGSFLMFQAVFVAGGTFIVHFIGSFLTWQWTAFILAIISFIDLIIVLYSPESPSYFISKGRYEEARDSFLWLRGDTEEKELRAMIEANIILKSQGDGYQITSFISFFKNLKRLYKKPEFYKPFLIMIHLYGIIQFAGVLILAAYAVDITRVTLGNNKEYIPITIVSANIQRMVTITCLIYGIKKMKRKTFLACGVGLTIASMLATAFYTYGLEKEWFGHPFVGILLFHMHYFSISAGSLTLPLVIAGEIFPLQYRGFSSSIAILIQSPMSFVVLKNFPLLLKTLGLHGAYCLYAALLLYCVLVALIMLPETKDRTLQDIEDEFRGIKVPPTGVLRPLKDNLDLD